MNFAVKAAIAAVALTVCSSAQAAPLVQNGGFEDFTLSPAQVSQTAGYVGFQLTYPDGTYSNAVDGWTSAQTAGYPSAYNLYFYDGATAKTGDAFTQYGGEQQRPNSNFTGSSPQGGAFMVLDGDPAYVGPLTQTINGLVAGTSYNLSFYWAAGELSNRTGYETVTLTGSFGADNFSTSTFNNSTPAGSPGDFSGWKLANFSFKAQSASQVLSFLAAGTPANNLPPVAFLDGVTLTPVPEPAEWVLMLVGIGGLGAVLRRRSASAATA
jgi:hypothetical protein